MIVVYLTYEDMIVAVSSDAYDLFPDDGIESLSLRFGDGVLEILGKRYGDNTPLNFSVYLCEVSQFDPMYNIHGLYR